MLKNICHYLKPFVTSTSHCCKISLSAESKCDTKLIMRLIGIRNCVLFIVPTSFTSRVLLYHDKSFARSIYSTSALYDEKSEKTVEPNTEAAASEQKASKRREQRKKLDLSKTFTERNFITPLRAMSEYLLKPSDLDSLRKIQRRSPFEDNPPIHVYLRRDVEQKSLEVWGSQEALQREIKKRQEEEQIHRDSIFHAKKILKEYTRSTMHQEELKRQEMILRTSGRVVITAVIINATNFALKLVAWLYTGSHSMFSEAIHSLADTGNQLLLAYGLKKSLQTPTEYHPIFLISL